jgi:hypothetical protein
MRSTCIVVATGLLGAAPVSAATPTLAAYTYSAGSGTVANAYVSSAAFKRPYGVAHDSTVNRVVVAGYYGQHIRAIADSTYMVTTFAGSATTSASGSTNAVGTPPA